MNGNDKIYAFMSELFKDLEEKDVSFLSTLDNISIYDYALIFACKYGRADMVHWLLENGTNVHVKDDMPVRYCVMFGHKDLMVELIDNYNANPHTYYEGAFRLCIETRRFDIIKLLVEKYHVDVNASPPFYGDPNGGTTALTISMSNKLRDITTYLLEHGADINRVPLCIREDYAKK